ncbi:MAG: DNA repair protein RadC [Clostridia bacterium]|nr:DNA repair protein RadC [Clostridia bacterium]
MNEKKNNPHQNHRARLRETFRKAGAEGMPDHNILEFLLFYSIPRKDTNEIAHRLIETFGSLKNVFEAPQERLAEVEGVGESSALLISMIPEICRRYIEGGETGKINLSEAEEVKKYISSKYYGCKKEVFYMICLDAVGNLINCCKMGEGTAGSVVLDKRTVLETAFRNNADTVIFAHNHPGGIAAPSKDDIVLTDEFNSLFRGVGIRLADHLIVGDEDILSLASLTKFRTLFI